MTQVQDVMTRNPVTCYDSDLVFSAVEVMKRQDVGVVPIVDQRKRCIGVVTDRDIVLEVIYNQRDPKTTLLRDIAAKLLLTCQADEDLDTAIQLMRSRQVKRIIVVDRDNRCIGILSEGDIAQKVGDKAKLGELGKGVYGGAR